MSGGYERMHQLDWWRVRVGGEPVWVRTERARDHLLEVDKLLQGQSSPVVDRRRRETNAASRKHLKQQTTSEEHIRQLKNANEAFRITVLLLLSGHKELRNHPAVAESVASL